ncbi:hypothetical protein A2U01_0074470, partial [Trifolium medium]|nr:hypothetical protein [Trifolium medium]
LVDFTVIVDRKEECSVNGGVRPESMAEMTWRLMAGVYLYTL